MQRTQLAVNANPFKYDPVWKEWVEGQTISEILTENLPTREMWNDTSVCIDGMIVKQEYWHVVRPKAGAIVTIRTLPQGDDVWRILGLIGLAIVAPIAGGYLATIFAPTFGVTTLAGAAALTTAMTGAVFLAGALLLNALIPPPSFDTDGDPNRTLSISGARNRLEPYGVIPMVLGKVRMYPPYASRPYGELLGDTQDVRMLFCLGYKDIEVEEDSIKLGDTPLTSYTDYEYQLDQEITDPPPTLVPQTVLEVVVGKKILMYNDVWVEHTSAEDVDRIVYEIHFPTGLVRIRSKDGDRDNVTVTIDVEYQLVGTTTWTPVPGSPVSITSNTVTPVRRGFEFIPPTPGQYSLRMRTASKQGADNTKKFLLERYFAILRNFWDEVPVQHPYVAQLAMRMLATDQLTGVPDTVNMVVWSKAATWNSTLSVWTSFGKTQNPAALARHVLTGRANHRALSTSRVDDDAFGAWYEFCETNNFTFNLEVNYSTTVHEVLLLIGAAGRARVMQVDSLWTVKIDEPQAARHQMFTPRNSSNLKVTKNYPDKLHAWRCRYVNEDEGYLPDEVIWYNTGYDVSSAENYELLEFYGVTKFEQVMKMARYYAAVIELQPETFTFTTDAEHLVVLPGDKVCYAHDALLIGLGAFRIKSIFPSYVQIDGSVDLDMSKTYGVRIRDSDGTSELHELVVYSSATYSVLFFATPGPGYGEVGDLLVFGEYGTIIQDLTVKDIIPGQDLSAELVCVPYNVGLYTEGAIPDYDTRITYDAGARSPVFGAIVSDETVLWRDNSGVVQNQISVSYVFLHNRVDVREILLQWRFYNGTDDGTWIPTGGPHSPDLPYIFIQGPFTAGDKVELRSAYIFQDMANPAARTEHGPWTNYFDSDKGTPYHTVVGQVAPPPDLDQFAVSFLADGMRVYDWGYDDDTFVPLDVAGVQIRYMPDGAFTTTDVDWLTLDGGDNFGLVSSADTFIFLQGAGAPDWEDMTPLAATQGVVTEDPYYAPRPVTDDGYYFAAKAIDLGGRLSLNPTYTLPRVTDLPPPPMGKYVAFLDHYLEGWLDGVATLTNCKVDPKTGFLIPIGTGTWNNVGTWDGGVGTWQGVLPASMVLEHPSGTTGTGTGTGQIILPTVQSVKFDEYLSIPGGTPLVEIKWKVNGVTWSGWVTHVPGTVYLGDQFSFRLTVTSPHYLGVYQWVMRGYL